MDKRAQNRSYRSRLWETVNLPGRAWEAVDSDGSEVMDKMRSIDEKIREVAEDVKPFIRQAKSALRRRNYLAAGHSIVGFHGRCKLVAHLLKSFGTHLELNHGSFLLNHFEDPYKDELLDSNPDFEINDEELGIAAANDVLEALIKEAGALSWMKDNFLGFKDFVTDTGSNLLTGEGLGKRLRDKRFNVGFMKQTKTQTTELVAKSSRMLNDLLSIFSELEKGVSRRNPRYYALQARKFVDKFNAYHKIFQKYHTDIILPLKAQRDAARAAAAKAKVEKEQVAEQKDYEDYNTRFEQQGNQIERIVQDQNLRHQPQVPPAYIEKSFDEWKKNNTTPPKATYQEGNKGLPQDKEFEEWNKKYTPPVTKPQVTNVTNIDKAQELKEDEEFEKIRQRNNLGDERQKKPSGKAASHQKFIGQITSYANTNDAPAFINTLLEYSKQLDDTDPDTSAELLTVASKLINEYKAAGIFDFLKGKPGTSSPADEPKSTEELPSALKYLQPEPQELAEQRQNFLRPKKVSLPNGKIEKSYTELGALKHITPDQMRVSGPTGRAIIATFATRLAKVKKIDDLEPYIEMIEANLIPQLKDAIYRLGWVIQSDPVEDTANPNDKYITIYTRLQLASVDSALSGVAKLYVNCRVSAEHGTLTLRNIVKNFPIDATKSNLPPTPAPQQSVPSKSVEETGPITSRSPVSTQQYDDNGDEIDYDEGHHDQDDYYDDPP